ncbi:MAG TPA: hypothetical protein VG756_01400 [Pseudonocardiaceae bacterium]|nr:hypothetical protein [Pseudonocardiaceae bacterium]
MLSRARAVEQAGPIAPSATPTASRAEPEAPGGREKTRRLRGHLARQLLFELALPLGGYYGLRALGVGSLPALILGGLLTVPWIGYGMVRNRRIAAMPVFTPGPAAGGRADVGGDR